MSSAGTSWLVWLAAGVSGAVLGGFLAAVWVAIYVDYEAPDVALFMVPSARSSAQSQVPQQPSSPG